MIRFIIAALIIGLLLHGILLFWKASTWRERLQAFRVATSNLVVASFVAIILAVIVQVF